MMRNGVKTRIALDHSCGLGRGEYPRDMQAIQDSVNERIIKITKENGNS